MQSPANGRRNDGLHGIPEMRLFFCLSAYLAVEQKIFHQSMEPREFFPFQPGKHVCAQGHLHPIAQRFRLRHAQFGIPGYGVKILGEKRTLGNWLAMSLMVLNVTVRSASVSPG